MAVRVNKSAFNIREKINELTKRFGLKGSELAAAETAQEAGSLLGVGRRNLCINGNFKIWQRATSIANGDPGNTTDAYKYVTADRWQTFYPNTYARQDSVLPNGERVYSFRETFSSTRLFFDHVIEDGGRIFDQGGDITISFWAKTSGPSTGVSLGFYWLDGPIWSNFTNSNVRKNVIIEGSEWKYYTTTVSLPTNANNRQHLAIEFDNNQNYGNWIQLSGTDYWEFANIQMEVGKVATKFEHRSYGEELALCQRYFTRLYFPNSAYVAQGGLQNSSNIRGSMIHLPTTLRSVPNASTDGSPNITFSGTGNGTGLFTFLQPDTSNPVTVGSIVMAGVTDSQIHAYGTNFTSLGSIGQTSQLYATNTAWINIDVEI